MGPAPARQSKPPRRTRRISSGLPRVVPFPARPVARIVPFPASSRGRCPPPAAAHPMGISDVPTRLSYLVRRCCPDSESVLTRFGVSESIRGRFCPRWGQVRSNRSARAAWLVGYDHQVGTGPAAPFSQQPIPMPRATERAATPPRRHAATPPRRHAATPLAATPPRRHAARSPRGHSKPHSAPRSAGPQPIPTSSGRAVAPGHEPAAACAPGRAPERGPPARLSMDCEGPGIEPDPAIA
jgi:hypothetical protein